MISPRAATALVGAVLVPSLSMGTANADAFAQLAAIPVVASPTCGGTVSADAQAAPVQIGDQVGHGVGVSIRYDAGVYDGSCTLTVTAAWKNLDTGAAGRGDITSVSTIDGHYGFIGYASTSFATGSGTVVITLSSHPGAEMRVTA
ncbi:hypothetical protein ACNO8X_03400 [Mycobacterium sp. PDNC021]|uniref:hypothetical protein n=1 Tax=Mycobacterium sp. PDNC021 TaxID=3391399 RepID=UPI003AAF0E05